MVFKFRPVKADEAKYLYPQSGLLDMLTNRIGTLRGSFGEYNELFVICESFLMNDIPQKFTDTLCRLMKYLYGSGQMLCDIRCLTSYCYSNPITLLDGGHEFGLRIDSDEYCFLLRLSPHKRTENIVCSCYMSANLDTHIYRASRGIRFLDSAQKERFRIQDGESIILSAPNGKEYKHFCRYTDDAHFEMNSNLYNICTFDNAMRCAGFAYRPSALNDPPTPVSIVEC